ncbi:SWIM zinc finger domain-containing protein [Bacillus cereus]
MNISNFEEYVDDTILQRGYTYFQQGKIGSIQTPSQAAYIIEVFGTARYKVEVDLDSNNFITHTDCNCLYMQGIHCKHQVAAFYAVREYKANKSSYIQPSDLRKILLQKSKEGLVAIICDIVNIYPEIKTQILFQHDHSPDNLESCSQVINEYIHAVQHRGFIDRMDVNYAVQGAELVLEKGQQTATHGNPMKAVNMCIVVLSMMIDLLQECDDSDGIVGGIIEESISAIDHIVCTHIDTMNESTKQQIFHNLLLESAHNRYDGWSEWKFDLLKICIYFCANQELRRQLESKLEEFIHPNSENSWICEYSASQWEMIQLQLIQLYDESNKEEGFIQQNLQYSEFREKAIIHAFQIYDYEQVIKLCLDGEKQDTNAPGLVIQWKKYRYKAYENLVDIEKQRKLGLEFVLDNYFEYYEKLKLLYFQSSWLEIREQIISEFETKAHPSHVYEQILISERLTDKLLSYCKKYPDSILNVYKYLLQDYPTETHKLFITHVQGLAQAARDREMYKKVCEIIQAYQRVADLNVVWEFIEQLKQTYKNSPAFIDELEKICN